MNVFTNLVANLSSINSATLTGAVDVVMVEQEDGTFLSTPFHVRFGKIGVVWSEQKIIDIEINEVEVDHLWMVLDDCGVAYFPSDQPGEPATTSSSATDTSTNNYSEVDNQASDIAVVDHDLNTSTINHVSIDNHCSDITVTNHAPDISIDNHNSDIGGTNHAPDISIDNHTSDVGGTNHAPDISIDNHISDSGSFNPASDIASKNTSTNHPTLKRQRSRHASDPQEDVVSNLLAVGRAKSNPDLLHFEEEEENKEKEVRREEDKEQNKEKEVRRTLRLDREKLEGLNLHSGCNEVTFSITTKFQGTARCSCNLFVWRQTDRVVISDIDGTITRSDVRGQLLTYTGLADWAQSSVTSLFSRIAENGYKLLYLSARPSTMAAETKAYLNSLKQSEVRLPPGPLFLNPESSLRSFKREVIDRTPEEFKISCLRSLQHLFTCQTPFWSGYGNRPNDVMAYEAVGIPRCKIFLINKAGDLRGQVSLTTLASSYSDQCPMVDHLCPPRDGLEGEVSLMPNYWKDPMLDIGDLGPLPL